jgi:CubicO group peptidase (beta-lactamase class C family)
MGMKIGRAAAAVAGLGLTVLAGCETQASLTKRRTRQVEKGLLRAVSLKGTKPEKLGLLSRLQFYKVPAASLAVMDRNALEWAKAYGVRDARAFEPAVPDTLFQAGALSQPLAAAAALRLAAEGKLGLDADIRSLLRGWKVPGRDPSGKAPVTLRRILTHTAGFPEGALAGYPESAAPPTLAEFLEGRGASAQAPVGLDAVPGEGPPRPSDAGFAVLQKLLEDVTGSPFAALMADRVLGPLEMRGSVFASALTEDRRALAASGHGRDGRPVEGLWFRHPALAARGLWTDPAELLSFVTDILSSAMGGEGKLLGAEPARAMLTPQVWTRSLGFAVEGEGTETRLYLRGRTEGFTCTLDVYPYRGQGAVVMTNSDNGFLFTDEVLRAVAAVYGWPGHRPEEKTLYRLDPSMYAQYVGRYEITPDYVLEISSEDYYLVIRPTGQAPTKFYVENPTFFFSVDPYIRIQFLTGAGGDVTGLVLWQQDFKQEARKVG